MGCVAPVLRVLEDADFFGDKTDVVHSQSYIYIWLLAHIWWIDGI